MCGRPLLTHAWETIDATLGKMSDGAGTVTLIGRQFSSDPVSLVFLTLAAGSILYVIIQLVAIALKGGTGPCSTGVCGPDWWPGSPATCCSPPVALSLAY